MEPSPTLDARIAAVAALDQPIRRALYGLVRDADDWTGRDEAAASLGLPRSVAAFHLDKLADAGVLEVRFERLGGRQGPGAGRPSKLYRAASPEIAASVPPRQYDLAGELLATAVEDSARTGTPVADCLAVAARAAGQVLGEAAVLDLEPGSTGEDRRRAVLDVLTAHAYEPELADGAEIVLANCPFHRLAEEHRQLVCGMNLDFVTGLIEGMHAEQRLHARLDPAPGFCCVRIAT